jgi:signal transduction histidine kinase
LASTTDSIYASEALCVLGEHRETDPILHRALPDLLQDPIALLLHAFCAKLSPEATIQLNIVGTGQPQATIDTLSSHRKAHLERWRLVRAHDLPMIWGNASSLREAVLLIAHNVRQHADRRRPIVVGVEVDETTLAIHVENHRRAPHVPGGGMGLRKIRACIDRIGATVTYSSDDSDDVFRLSLTLRVDQLRLRELGAGVQ